MRRCYLVLLGLLLGIGSLVATPNFDLAFQGPGVQHLRWSTEQRDVNVFSGEWHLLFYPGTPTPIVLASGNNPGGTVGFLCGSNRLTAPAGAVCRAVARNVYWNTNFTIPQYHTGEWTLWTGTVSSNLQGEPLFDEVITIPTGPACDVGSLMVNPGRTLSINGGTLNLADGSAFIGGALNFDGCTMTGPLTITRWADHWGRTDLGTVTLSSCRLAGLGGAATNVQITRCQIAGNVTLTTRQFNAVDCLIGGDLRIVVDGECRLNNTRVATNAILDGYEVISQTNNEFVVRRAGRILLENSQFEGGLSASAASVSARDCRSGWGRAALVEGDIVYISKSRFDRESTARGSSYCGIEQSEFWGPARLDLDSQEIIARENVFGALCTLGGTKSGTVTLEDNSFFGRLSLTNDTGLWPAGDVSLVDKNYYGSPIGPLRPQDPEFLQRAYLLQYGGFCNLPATINDHASGLKQPATALHPASAAGPWPLPEIWAEGFSAGQTTLGTACGEIRAGRKSLAVYDVRCAADGLPGTKFTLLCDGIELQPCNPSFVPKRSYCDPRGSRLSELALSFELPAMSAGYHTVMLKCDTTGVAGYTNTGVRSLMTNGLQVLPRYGRPLRIGVLKLVLNDARMTNQCIPAQCQQIKDDAVNMLGLQTNEIYTENIGMRFFKPAGGIYTLLWLAQDIEAKFQEENAARRRILDDVTPLGRPPLDYVVAVVSANLFDAQADGATLMGYWLDVPHVAFVKDAKPTAWLHELGHLFRLYWIDIGSGIYYREQYDYTTKDNFGNLVSPPYGAYRQEMTVYNPNHYKTPPNKITHYPTFYPAWGGLWDTMGAAETSWPIPTTFKVLSHGIRVLLGTTTNGSKALPALSARFSSDPAATAKPSSKLVRVAGSYGFIEGQPHIMPETVALSQGVWPKNGAANINGVLTYSDAQGNRLGQSFCSDMFFAHTPTNVVRQWQQDFEVPQNTAMIELTDFNPVTHVFTRIGFWTQPAGEATNLLSVVGAPAKGASLGEDVTLEWNVSGSCAGLRSTLYASRDGGVSWLGLGAPATTNRATVSLAALGGSSNLLFKVVSADAFRSVEYQLPDVIPAQQLPPHVELHSPRDGDCGLTNQLWTLSASALAEADSASVEWRSSIDGLLGTNALLTEVLLSEGSHLLTFRAQDARGLVTTSNLTVRVGPRLTWTIVLRDDTLQIHHPNNPESAGRYLKPGATNVLVLNLHNQGISNAVTVKLFVQGVGTAEQWLATTNLFWDIFDDVPWSCPWMPARQGTNRIRVVVEPAPGSDVAIVTNQFIWTFANSSPVALDNLVDLTPLQTNISFYLQGWDPDGDAISYSITRAPAHGTLVLNGSMCQYTPDLLSTNESFDFGVSDGMAKGSGTIRLSIPERPQPPLIVSTNFEVTPDEPFTLSILALHKPDYFTSANLPEELHLDMLTGRITGTLGKQQHRSFTVSAVNSAGSDSRAISVRVLFAWPKFLSATNLFGVANEPFRYQCVATHDANTFLVLPPSSPPAWLTINRTNGLITGIPTQTGRFTFTLTVANNEGFCSPTLNLVVLDPSQAFDYFDYARTLTNLPITLRGTNTSASYEPGDPDETLTGSLWWTWTAPSNGLVVVDTLGGALDATLAVYTGAQITNLSLVARNDNIDTTNLASRVCFVAAAGTTYRIMLDARSRGAYQLNLRYEQGAVVLGPTVVQGVSGRSFECFIQALNTPSRFFATGLPPDLVVNTNTGRIFGTPHGASTNNVTLGAANNLGTNTLLMKLQIGVLPASVQVATNGGGTVSPNYNGTVLEIGRVYSMTASPLTGWVFTNWSGSVSTNHPTLSFAMETNLSFTACFADAQAPTLEITAPVASSRLSNALVAITGTAADNGPLAAVKYQLNSGPWIVADGTSNWTAAAVPQPGTNTVRAFALDSGGNRSLTNSVSFVHLPTAILGLQWVGQGTLTPNYANVRMALGQAYSIAAAGTNGHKFSRWELSTNWGSPVVTTNATLSFTMQSNLTLSAVFADTNRPVAAVTNLVGNQRLSNGLFMVKGTARDNVQIINVSYQLNSNGWNGATGTTNWTASLSLSQRTNLLQVVAADASGNLSTISNVTFIYVRTNILRVQTLGQGSLSNNYNNSALEIGQAYSMTATPTNGHRFDRWTVATNWGDGAVVTNRTLSFTMQSNLTLTVVFLDTNRPTVTISNPIANQRISNAVFAARGSAKDNVGVSNVWCRVNSGPWTRAVGTGLWTNLLVFSSGTNVLQAFAEDAAGNRGITNHVTFVGVVPTNAVNSLRAGMLRPDGTPASLHLLVQAANRSLGVQFSQDLVNWVTVGVFTNATGTLEVPVLECLSHPSGFYRVLPLP